MAEPIQLDIKVEEEQILCQYYPPNMINASNIQLEESSEANEQGTKDGAEDFESISALSTKHCDMDNDDEEHECTLCAKSFQSEKLFKAHIKEHVKLDGLINDSGGEEEFQTIKDSETKNADHQSIPSEKSAHLHTNDEESPFKCLHCPKKYATKLQLKSHLYTHKYGRAYKCEICSKRFPCRSNLEIHMRDHTSECPYKCEICSKALKNMSNLMIHMRVHIGESTYKCEQCSKTFKSMTQLKSHMLSHTDERPYKCETCSKTFKTGVHLKTHKRVHSGERPYTCETCSKCFHTTAILKDHMRVHTGESPYKCEICSKTYKSTSALGLHKRRHTESPFQCDQFPKKFSTKKECENHAFKH